MSVINIVAASINGGALIAFWVWARSNLMVMNREIGELKAWGQVVETRCEHHNNQLGKLFDKVDEVKSIVSRNDTATAKAIAHMTGKVDVLIQKGNDS